MKGKMMGIPPSGEHTALTREQYLRLRDEEAKRPKGKRRNAETLACRMARGDQNESRVSSRPI